MANPTPTLRRMRTALTQQRSAALDLTDLTCATHRELHLTVRPLPGEAPSDVARRLGSVLSANNAAVVRHEIFGSLAACEATLHALQRECGADQWPVICLEGAGQRKGEVAGMHVFAVAGATVETLHLRGQPIGRTFSDGHTQHFLFGDVRSSHLTASKPDQAREMFENLEGALREQGLSMANVVRTWLFLDDILSWYDGLNRVRTEFFQERGVFKGLVPASTGVGGRNLAGAAALAGAWAVRTANGAVAARAIPSPLQCPAPEYGSSFSRAVQFTAPGCKRVLVSGTASIEPNGQSIHFDDLRAQIALTMDVVRAILTSRGMDFADTARATAYFKDIRGAQALEDWRREQGVGPLPIVVTQCDVCRDELLFELELDALASATTD